MKLIPLVLATLLALPASAASSVKRTAADASDASARTVTLDVKDAEVRAIFASMQKQCGIRNVIVDPDVKGEGTFFFRAVPCSTAFDVVFRTLGLRGVTYDDSLVNVRSRSH